MKHLKFFSLLIALLLAVVFCFSCVNTPDVPDDDGPDTPPDEPSGSYEISSFKIDGSTIRDFVIVTNKTVPQYSDAATALQTLISEKTGVTLGIEALSSTATKRIEIKEVQKAGESGFCVYVKDGNLYIDIAYRLLTPIAFEEFINAELKDAVGEFELDADYTYEAPVKTIKYSDHGAKGDGVTDDYKAIKDTHDKANLYGYRVEGDANATYYIGAKGLPTVTIKTSTDWKGAKFIIDDSTITVPGVGSAKISLFTVQPSLPQLKISTADVTSLAKGATNLGYAPGVECLVYVEYNGRKQYIRYGTNADNGANQQEILLVKADGTIDKNTRPIWDYPQITKIWAVPTDENPIVIQNGIFKTIANEINPTRYESVDRGIYINRSNTTIKNVEHTVEQTKDYRAAYSGFFNIRNSNNVLIYDCKIYGHINSYYLANPETGTMAYLGSYELSAGHSNNIRYEKVVQTNFFEVENKEVRGLGIMGTNYCKNMYVEDSMFSRFDAHRQIYNLTIEDCDFQRINTIGFGTVKVEDTTFWGSYLVDLRSDYGGLFNGDFHFKNITVKYGGNDRIAFFSGSWANHDFGYTVVQPQNVYIENLEVEKGGVIYLYTSGLDAKPDLTAQTVNGQTNLNPIVPTKLVKVTSNPAKTTFRINAGPTFANTKLELPEGEESDPDDGGSSAVSDAYVVYGSFDETLSVNKNGYLTSNSAANLGTGSIAIQCLGNGHNHLNLRLVNNGTNQALLFSGCGNPTNATAATNICVDIKPAPGLSNIADMDVYNAYKGKSFVVAFDIKPIAKTSNANDNRTVEMFTFSNFYTGSAKLIQSGVVQMKLDDYSLNIKASANRDAIDLNTKLEVGVYSTIAMHVKLTENKFDLYVNDKKIASDVTFMTPSEIDTVHAYDANGALVPSTKANKLEDFLFSYARLARVNGWYITGDIYEFDNAKLYFSETYLGTGDLKEPVTQ